MSFSFEKLEWLLTTRLCEIMHIEWASLYRREGRSFVAAAVPPALPRELASDLLVMSELGRQESPVRPGDLEPLKPLDPHSRVMLEALSRAGSRVLAPLRSRDRLHALLVLGPKLSGEEYGRDDLQVIRTLANQGAVALENAQLLRERTRQLELEKELEIARRVQFSLIPATLPVAPGWEVAARCVPARQVGGDFYDALPGLRGREPGLRAGGCLGQVRAGGDAHGGGSGGAADRRARWCHAWRDPRGRQPAALHATSSALRRPDLPAARS